MVRESILPHDRDAERFVLGSLLIDPVHMATAISLVSAGDFYVGAHRRIFAAMVALTEQSRPIEIVTLADCMRVESGFEAAGGTSYLASLVDGLPRISAIDAWCQIVRDKSLLRRISAAGSAMIGACQDGGVSGVDALARAYAEVLSVAKSEPSGFREPKLDIDEGLAALDALTSGQDNYGVHTGIRSLDKLLIGAQPGDLIVIGARPSVGKTAMGIAIAEHVSASGGIVAFFSLEMTRRQIATRRLCATAKISIDMLRTARESNDTQSYGEISKAAGKIIKRPFLVDDTSAINVAQVAAKARQLQMQHGDLAMIVVDYVQLMRSGERAENRVREVAQICHGLKALAKDLRAPVVALSQLNRASETKGRPSMSDLRESGDLEQDADVVILLHRPGPKGNSSAETEGFNAEASENRPEGELEIILDKQRNGPTGIATVWFQRQYGCFESCDRHFSA
jgi:replicative DNA helicase